MHIKTVCSKHQVETIAFPNISTGVYHFPKDMAAEIAITTVLNFLEAHQSLKEVIFVCFDVENYDTYQNFIKN
jgi:O-acetyl-ADP-ribose deacetylase (regulator of RNase III)